MCVLYEFGRYEIGFSRGFFAMRENNAHKTNLVVVYDDREDWPYLKGKRIYTDCGIS